MQGVHPASRSAAAGIGSSPEFSSAFVCVPLCPKVLDFWTCWGLRHNKRVLMQVSKSQKVDSFHVDEKFSVGERAKCSLIQVTSSV